MKYLPVLTVLATSMLTINSVKADITVLERTLQNVSGYLTCDLAPESGFDEAESISEQLEGGWGESPVVATDVLSWGGIKSSIGAYTVSANEMHGSMSSSGTSVVDRVAGCVHDSSAFGDYYVNLGEEGSTFEITMTWNSTISTVANSRVSMWVDGGGGYEEVYQNEETSSGQISGTYTYSGVSTGESFNFWFYNSSSSGSSMPYASDDYTSDDFEGSSQISWDLKVTPPEVVVVPPVVDPVDPRVPPTQDCSVPSYSTGKVHMSCVSVIDAFGGKSLYDVDMSLTSGSNPLSFVVDSVKDVVNRTINECTPVYSDGVLNMPCIDVEGAFGSVRYTASLKITNGSPVVLELVDAKIKP